MTFCFSQFKAGCFNIFLKTPQAISQHVTSKLLLIRQYHRRGQTTNHEARLSETNFMFVSMPKVFIFHLMVLPVRCLHIYSLVLLSRLSNHKLILQNQWLTARDEIQPFFLHLVDSYQLLPVFSLYFKFSCIRFGIFSLL